MTTASATHPTTPAPRLRQLRALSAAEWRELARNKVALVNSVGLPPLLGLMMLGLNRDGAPLGAMFPVMVTSTAILFVVYYTLVTAVVARRESLLLKRLRTGEADDATILAGIAVPFAVVTLIQFALSVVLARVLFQLTLTPGLAIAALGVALACATFTALAVASTAFTRTVEHAQITTLPVILIPMILSGLMLPLSMMPAPMRTVAELSPLAPVVELLQLGVGVVTSDGRAVAGLDVVMYAARPTLVLACWCVLGVVAARRWMRWEPRS